MRLRRRMLPRQSHALACRGVLALLLWGLAGASANAAAACTGKLAALQSYAGKYLSDADPLDAPSLAAVLERLPDDEIAHLRRNLDVSGAVELVDCHLVWVGNAPHMGTEQDAMVDVDLVSGTLVAAIHGGGRIDVHVVAEPGTVPDWEALPLEVRMWVVRADMGFPRQQPSKLSQPDSVRLHAPGPAVPAARPDPGETVDTFLRSHALPWKNRVVGGNTEAVATPIDSVIRTLGVSCVRGQLVLAMLLKMPRAPQHTILTWVFNGWTVNVAMQPANQDGTLWTASLSGSQIPQWLAHRGTDAVTRQIAPFVTTAYLRLNGEMYGQVSMEDSAAATALALAGC